MCNLPKRDNTLISRIQCPGFLRECERTFMIFVMLSNIKGTDEFRKGIQGNLCKLVIQNLSKRA